MKVISPDGAALSVAVEGSGPPLMMVSGTGDDYTRYGRVVPLLSSSFTLYRLERRGRGASTDGAGPYALEREIEDMVATLAAIHGEAGPVSLVAHSHSAVTCLEAMARTDALKAAMLYEPPMPYYERVDGKDPRAELIQTMVALQTAGDIDAVIVHYLHDFLGTPMGAIERQRANPRAWTRWRSMAHTIARELLAIRTYRFEPQKFAHVRTPLCILVGTASRPAMRRTAERIKGAMPHVAIQELPGQGHIAMTAAPEMFASAVLTFFNSIH
jgi:pimeloyl-ACP methyl ester carboxylesterase